jgi:hypothetical protein
MPRAIAIALFLLPGCIFQRFSPTELLTQQVRSLNDETRWGQVDIAADRVEPTYRDRFMSRRDEWGTDVRIADTELSRVVVAEDLQSATSLLEITWYDQRTMEVSETVLSQHWVKRDDAYLLDDETITGGDDTLFAFEESDEAIEEEDGILPSG